jgi:cytohesin
MIAEARSLEVFRVLLDLGADPTVVLERGGTVIDHLACHSSATVEELTDMIRLLVDHGADLNPPDSTPIWHAALRARPGPVEALLAAGADPHNGYSPLSSVCFNYSDDRDTDIEAIIDMLVEAGVDPDERDRDGDMPLHMAMSQGSDGFNAAAVVALLEHGASIDIVFRRSGYRPLHAAVVGGSDIAVGALLDAGADPTEPTPAGETALDLARALLADVQTRPSPKRRTPTSLLRDEDRDPIRVARCVELLERALAT